MINTGAVPASGKERDNKLRKFAQVIVVSAGLAGMAVAGGALAADTNTSGVGGIYTCTDSTGKRLRSDRPIRECMDREQRELNRDGSQKRLVQPPMTADERARYEEVQRRQQVEQAARQDAIKRDRNLLARFPNEDAHNKAREAALDDVRNSIKVLEGRLDNLAKERKPLHDEAEFYKGRALPFKLRSQLENNQVSAEAQETLIQNQRAELARINGLYDSELAHLRKLWAGAPAGSAEFTPVPKNAAPAAGSAPR